MKNGSYSGVSQDKKTEPEKRFGFPSLKLKEVSCDSEDVLE